MIQNKSKIKNDAAQREHVVVIAVKNSKEIVDHKSFDEKYDNAPYWKPKKQIDLENLLHKSGYNFL